MIDLTMVLLEMQELNQKIESILTLSWYKECDDLSEIAIDYQDGQQLFLQEELSGMMDKLSVVSGGIKYLSQPIRESSHLHKNRIGRYETEQGHYFTSGSRIEVRIVDDYHEVPYWVRTRVEHDGTDYYLVGHKDICMEGLPVRVREVG